MLHQPHFCWPWYLQFSSWLWAGCLHSEQVSPRRFLGATMAHRRYFCTPFFMKPGPNMPQSRTSMNEVLASWKIHMRPTWLASKLPSDGEMPANSAWDEVLSGSSSRSMGNSVSPTGTFVRSKPVHWWMACSETLIFEPILSSVSSSKPEVSHSATHNGTSFGDAITSCELRFCATTSLSGLSLWSVAIKKYTAFRAAAGVWVLVLSYAMHVNLCKETTNNVIIVHLAEHPYPPDLFRPQPLCAVQEVAIWEDLLESTRPPNSVHFQESFGLSLLRSMWTHARERNMSTPRWAKPARLVLAASVTAKQWSMWPILCFSSSLWMNDFRTIAKKGYVFGESPSKR